MGPANNRLEPVRSTVWAITSPQRAAQAETLPDNEQRFSNLVGLIRGTRVVGQFENR